MPKTKFQNIVFALMMTFIMVYAMICYNIALNIGGMTNEVFIMALGECGQLPLSQKSLSQKGLSFTYLKDSLMIICLYYG